MAELKTQKNNASVSKYLDKAAASEEIRADCERIVVMMTKATRAEPMMWGNAIVGFGSFVYRYQNGKELEWMLCGFSPRKANISLYLLGRFPGFNEMLSQMGKHSCGKGCLYVKRLADVDEKILQKLITESVKYTKKRGSADRESAKAEGRAKRTKVKKKAT